MSRYLAFRRQPVDPQVAQHLQTKTFPAPTRGIVQNENQAYMQPGGAIMQVNWAPTMRGVKLRGGYIRHCDLHALDTPVPPIPSAGRLPVISAFEYVTATQRRMFAANASNLYDVTSATPELVAADQNSGNWAAAQYANAAANWMIAVNEAADPILRFNGTSWTSLETSGITSTVWTNGTSYAVGAIVTDPVTGEFWKALVAHTSAATGSFEDDRAANPGNWDADQAADGASWITGPPDSNVSDGSGLSYVWKYRNRLFFIESGSMNAWYLGIDSVGGALQQIPLAGAATMGGQLLFGAVWSLDAGDGTDDKCVFVTDLGEALVFSGSNPSEATSWKQEGRYNLAEPLGMNAHITIGGDLLVLTVDGIIPISQAITKEAGQLELAMLTRTIKPLWRQEVAGKRSWPWTAKKWDDYGAVFVTTPGGRPGQRYCLVANNATGAWCRYGPNYDATCFIRLRSDMFFGTQDGLIMQAERTGYDDGNDAKLPYTGILVGGWEMFGAPSAHFVWHQSRAAFLTGVRQPFKPQLSATVNYNIKLPPAPPPGEDTTLGEDGGPLDVWDEALWGPPGTGGRPPTPEEVVAWGQWDNTADFNTFDAMIGRNTLWISIGRTGFAHAPILQMTIAQRSVPRVELVAISATYEPAGVNVD